ncbi:MULTISPECIES: glycosyltransferase family 4 protein [unclassified Shewanella]|uniref:glycosyltransferase family 4 protein n=1 Tax=unclassified Shewanella TaxID=196818 RepID=UPI0021D89997|nr:MULTISPECIES: glycosyltransferase family 4 protein [unclassified Shewanella]MCU8044145.1 glycosyltransferase family 4 protein [Shewanella sp. SM68]MCU8048227.1 glycosyltransferase family 4 protein [Shewanella sp. SM65]
MKILFIVPSLESAGPINVVFELVKKLSKDNEVHVFSFSKGGRFKDFEQFANKIFISSRSKLLQVFFLASDIDLNFYDVVHSHCLLPDIASAFAFSASNNTYTTIHNSMDKDYILLYGQLLGNILYRLHLLVLKKIKYRVSCSNSVAEYLLSHFQLETKSICNGVSESELKPRKSGNCNSNKLRFVSVGVLNQRKNTQTLLDAFIKLDIEKYEFIVIGDGPLLSSLNTKYQNKSNIIFLGNCKNVRDLLSSSDVFLSSSMAEGLPMALLEALSEGVTYIISDILPHLEINRLSPDSGIVVGNTVDEFFSAMKSITLEQVNERRIICKTLFDSNFSSRKMADDYLELYRLCML